MECPAYPGQRDLCGYDTTKADTKFEHSGDHFMVSGCAVFSHQLHRFSIGCPSFSVRFEGIHVCVYAFVGVGKE